MRRLAQLILSVVLGIWCDARALVFYAIGPRFGLLTRRITTRFGDAFDTIKDLLNPKMPTLIEGVRLSQSFPPRSWLCRNRLAPARLVLALLSNDPVCPPCPIRHPCPARAL